MAKESSRRPIAGETAAPPSSPPPALADARANPERALPAGAAALVRHGWLQVAAGMALGLLLEGLLGYKSPAYLDDAERRALWRLGHSHGTLLGLLLIAAGLCARHARALPRPTRAALRLGALLMPLGFFLAGLTHPEGDPGWGIWLVPPGGLLVLWGAVSIALALRP